ncbi:MAG: T9SS type A sorting domain-containing protein [Bacteroidales bacterium]|nr:T9SS type A sorting domain-containing protein [Bacteroidales bacterium]
MKKQIPLFFAILATLFITLAASAQGEWKWANYWTGNDDPLNSTNPYNYIVRTAFDDDGNVYVFGNFGGNARIYDQNQSSYFCSQVSIIAANTPGTVLAKFDVNGNLLWEKVIKSSYDMSNMPYDMYLYDNRIVIAGEYSWDGGLGKQLWFIDTLITQQVAQSYPSIEHNPPFTFGAYTYFVFLDLDGNTVQSHFVKSLTRELYNGQQDAMPLGRGLTGAYPICIDSYENTYIATPTQYGGSDTLPYTIVIDEDSTKIYNFFLSENCTEPGYVVNNIMLYKFTSNWTLEWMKAVVASTEGLASPSPTHTDYPPIFIPYVGGMNIDENDNLYLSGSIGGVFLYDEYNQYPMRFFWDSTHYATISDHGLAHSLPFIIKYDSDGNVQWASQAFVRNPEDAPFNNSVVWTDNCLKEQSVYLMGYAELLDGLSADYSFGDDSNIVPISQYSSYFARFNKDNGAFESCGVVPGEKTTLDLGKSSVPAVTNNHFLGICRNYYNSYYLLNYFNVNGTFDRADTIWYMSKNHSARQGVAVNDDGYILCNIVANQDLIFGHDLTLNFDDHQHSHAVVALRSDPSILVPYPEDTIGIAVYSGSSVRLYPNPAANTIYVENEDSPIEYVIVLDMNGKEILRQDVLEHKATLNISFLPNGMYFVKTCCNGSFQINKFVKSEF